MIKHKKRQQYNETNKQTTDRQWRVRESRSAPERRPRRRRRSTCVFGQGCVTKYEYNIYIYIYYIYIYTHMYIYIYKDSLCHPCQACTRLVSTHIICKHTLVRCSFTATWALQSCCGCLHSAKGGAVETGCSGLHSIIGCFII